MLLATEPAFGEAVATIVGESKLVCDVTDAAVKPNEGVNQIAFGQYSRDFMKKGFVVPSMKHGTSLPLLESCARVS